MSDTDTSPAPANTDAWKEGALVLDGRFKLLAPLGKGGVTEAWLAEHTHLGKKVALKVLRPDLGLAPGMGDRFAEEVRRLAGVNHAAVARVLDFGSVGPLTYLVTEVAEGQPLRALLTGDPLMPDRAVELLCQIAEGLAAIHEQGIVHRDLKPENVFVVGTPTGERVRLLDFGIARLVDPEVGSDRVTLMIKPVGLPQYMSPEQARGAPTDARSDLYSFGVLAYELLSGRLPFDGPGVAEYMIQHQEKAPLPLAEAAPHLVDNLRLLDLVARCLDKDPAKRPANARELAQKLGRVPQVGEPTILMEALQHLPPALPVRKPAPALAPAPAPAAAAAAPVGPPPLPPALPPQPGVAAPPPAAKPLLASVVMPSPSFLTEARSPLLDPPRPLAPEPPRKLKVALVAGLGAAAALAVVGLAMTAKKTPADEARSYLEEGKKEEALSVITNALKDQSKRSDPQLLSVLAATMHALDRHRDEATLFKDELAPKAPELLDPLILGGPLEDLGKNEAGPWRELLKRIPKEPLYGVLKPLAQGDRSPQQWGALRYLDLEGSASELDLVKLYVAALESDVCAEKRIAAKRLGQLGDAFAEEPLTRLKAAPRPKDGDKACGQDEAGWALAQLGKKKAPAKAE